MTSAVPRAAGLSESAGPAACTRGCGRQEVGPGRALRARGRRSVSPLRGRRAGQFAWAVVGDGRLASVSGRLGYVRRQIMRSESGLD